MCSYYKERVGVEYTVLFLLSVISGGDGAGQLVLRLLLFYAFQIPPDDDPETCGDTVIMKLNRFVDNDDIDANTVHLHTLFEKWKGKTVDDFKKRALLLLQNETAYGKAPIKEYLNLIRNIVFDNMAFEGNN